MKIIIPADLTITKARALGALTGIQGTLTYEDGSHLDVELAGAQEDASGIARNLLVRVIRRDRTLSDVIPVDIDGIKKFRAS